MENLKLNPFIEELLKIAARYHGGKFVRNFYRKLRSRIAKSESTLRKKSKALRRGNGLTEKEVDVETAYTVFLHLYETGLGIHENLQMSIEVGHVSVRYGEYVKAVRMYRETARKAGKSKVQSVVAKAIMGQAEVCHYREQWNRLDRLLKRALAIYTILHDSIGKAQVRITMGNSATERGRLKAGEKHYLRVLPTAEQTRNFELLALAHNNLGNVWSMRGDWKRAVGCYQRSILRSEPKGDIRRLTMTYGNLGLTFMRQGRYSNALAYYQKGLRYASRFEDLYNKGNAFVGIAELYFHLSDLALSSAYATNALAVYYKMDNRSGVAECYKVKGMIERQLKNWETAETYLQTGLKLNKEVGNLLNVGEIYYELAVLHHDLEKEEARRELRLALSHFRKVGAEKNIERAQQALQMWFG
jgi:tetratricopeptide (TPR) repeat protein